MAEVLFRLQVTRDGVVTISRMPTNLHEGTVEKAAASVLRTIADALETGAMRLTEGEVPA